MSVLFFAAIPHPPQGTCAESRPGTIAQVVGGGWGCGAGVRGVWGNRSISISITLHPIQHASFAVSSLLR